MNRKLTQLAAAFFAATTIFFVGCGSQSQNLNQKSTETLLEEASVMMHIIYPTIFIETVPMWPVSIDPTTQSIPNGIARNLDYIKNRLTLVLSRKSEVDVAYSMLGYSILKSSLEAGLLDESCIPYLEEYNRRDPQHFHTVLTLSGYYADYNQPKLAYKMLEQMNKHFPNHELEALHLSYYIPLKQGDYKTALTFSNALCAIGAKAQARMLEGICYYMLGNDVASDLAFTKAVEADPEYSEKVPKIQEYYRNLRMKTEPAASDQRPN